jgi:hypothetical protein
MSKVVRLNEKDIEGLVKKIMSEEKNVNEAWPKRELDRKATSFRRADFDPYKREKDVQKIFGKYSEDVPPQVIQYMRKNPASIIKRLVDIYGIDEVYNYINMATGDTMPPMEESYNIFGKGNNKKHSSK